MLHQLSLTTKLGASSYNFLHKLVQATPELSLRTANKKPQTNPKDIFQSSSMKSLAVSTSLHAPAGISSEPFVAAADPLHQMTVSDHLSFDVEQFLANNPFGEMSDPTNVDLAGMEQIWGWENLHLDAFPTNEFSA